MRSDQTERRFTPVFESAAVLRFEGGIVLRSHLRMSGRWSIRPRGETRAGKPWLVLQGDEVEAVLWNGPVLEPHTRALARLAAALSGGRSV